MSVFDVRDDAAETRARKEVPGPLDGDREVGMSTGEAQEVDEHPCAPCEEARHLRVHLRLVDDGLAAADRGHGAEVLVVERREVLLAADELHDVVMRRLCLLHGDRCNRRQRALRAVLIVCAVADGEDAVAALDLQFLVDDDAAARSTSPPQSLMNGTALTPAAQMTVCVGIVVPSLSLRSLPS